MNWPFGRRRDEDLDEEIEAHLRMAVQERLERGEPFDAAWAAARREFGSRALVKELTRETWGWTWLEALRQDLGYGVRSLRRTPGFTSAVIVTLTLVIGASTAIFSVVNALMLRPLPVREPDRLVELLWQYPGDPQMSNFGWHEYEHYRDRTRSLSDLFGATPVRFHVTREAFDSETVDAEYVTGTFFPALGIQPAAGRWIGPDDDRLDASDPAVLVLSWAYWNTRFNLDPSVVGQRIFVHGVPATIVGVAPRGFVGFQTGRPPAFWVPAAMEPLVEQPSRRADDSMRLWLVGRLKPGVSLEEAQAELRVLHRFRIEELATSSGDPLWRQTTFVLGPAGAGLSMLRYHFGGALLALMAIVAVLLLIACTNVASLLAARAAARQREMAVRVALGAGRVRIIRQLLAESLLLAAAGGVLGVALAWLGAHALVHSLPVDPRWHLDRYDIPLGADLRVLLFTGTVALAAAILSGLAPAWSAFRSAASSSLRDIGVGAETKSRRLGGALVAVQVALSMVMLSAAVLLIQHVSDLRTRDIGFERDSVLLVRLDPARSGYSPDQRLRAYQELTEHLQHVAGVRSVSLAAHTPIQRGAASEFVRVEGFEEDSEARRRVSLNWVGPAYFETLGTPLLSGRAFTAQDEGGPPVAVVNERMARHYFVGRTAIGGRLTLEGQERSFEIVGVAADAKYADLREPAPPTLYLHAFQEARGNVSQLALRTDVPPSAVAAAVRRTVNELLPSFGMASLTTLAEQLDRSLVLERLVAKLTGAFGVLGTFLAAVGLYGLLAFTVARRTNEIGLRRALGASDHRVMRMVLEGALALVSLGLLLGVPLALLGGGPLAQLLGIPGGAMVWPLALAAVMMLAVALLAAWLPARRAVRVHPVEALRHL